MMAFLTKLSLQKASITLLIAIALVAGGVYATIRINKELTPDMDLPLVTVVSAYPGARSEDVAQDLAIPLETAISGVSGIKSLQSVSADGFAILIVYFDYGENMKEVEREVKENIAGAKLPDGATTPQVMRLNINQMIPVVQLSLSGDIGTKELERIAREQIVPKLMSIDNVQAVDVVGGLTQQVSVVVDPVKMQALGITRSAVSGVLAANNIAIPSGTVGVEGNSLSMRTVSTLTSLDEIENLAVGFNTSGAQPRPVLLKEVATVQITSEAT